MEAPQQGMYPEVLVLIFENHIEEHYDDLLGTRVCKDCGSQIQTVVCKVAVHRRGFPVCVGKTDEILDFPLPYCPVCEGVPKKTSTCMHC